MCQYHYQDSLNDIYVIIFAEKNTQVASNMHPGVGFNQIKSSDMRKYM